MRWSANLCRPRSVTKLQPLDLAYSTVKNCINRSQTQVVLKLLKVFIKSFTGPVLLNHALTVLLDYMNGRLYSNYYLLSFTLRGVNIRKHAIKLFCRDIWLGLRTHTPQHHGESNRRHPVTINLFILIKEMAYFSIQTLITNLKNVSTKRFALNV